MGTEDKKINSHLKVCLRNSVSTGLLKQVKGTGASSSFKIGNEPKPEKKVVKKPEAEKKPVAKKAAAKKVAKKIVAKKTTTKNSRCFLRLKKLLHRKKQRSQQLRNLLSKRLPRKL